MAIIFSIAIIFVFMLVGLSLFDIIRLRTKFHLRLLLAPTLGVSANVITLFTLSRIGFPLKNVALPLFIVEIFLIGIFLVNHRTIWLRRTYLYYCIAAIMALMPYYFPLSKFGFEWLAFVNGDMSYYSTSSTRLLDYAYSELPLSGNIHDIKDHSLLTWTFHNELSYRTGADLVLAYLVGLTGLTAHQVYMPLILAFNFCVISSAGALSILSFRKWTVALWTVALLALSPMLTIEVTMQQLAQALGLALLTSLSVSYAYVISGYKIRLWALIYTSMSFGALAISYFELIPFFILYIFILEITRWKKFTEVKFRTAYMRATLMMGTCVLFLLNSYAFSTVQRIVYAAKMSFNSSAMTMQTEGVSAFPYFFLPINGALLWGWMPLSGNAEPITIVLGLLATMIFLIVLFTSRIKKLPSAIMSIVMLSVAVAMWFGGNGYGLFKIAMFIQPFFVPTVLAMFALFVTRRLLQNFGYSALGVSLISSQQANILRVSSDVGSSPVAYASTAQLGKQLRSIRENLITLASPKVFSDTTSFELFSLEAYYFKGIPFDNLTQALPLLSSVGSLVNFSFASDKVPVTVDIRNKRLVSDFNEYLLTTSSEFSIINRSTVPTGLGLLLKPMHEVSNHLILLETSLSAANHRFDGNALPSLFQLEHDPVYMDGTMSAVGQYQVYELVGGVLDSRLKVSISSSFNKYRDFLLPKSLVVATDTESLPLVGRGSARVVSKPVKPRKIASSDYLGIDFGSAATYIDRKREGVFALFGQKIKYDSRKIVTYARDISYISPSQYNSFKRPHKIQEFPASLADPNLEYSGIFEDGWVSDVAYVMLQMQPLSTKHNLKIIGQIPDINGKPFSTILTIKVNDHVIYNARHTKGDVNINVPIDDLSGTSNTLAKIQIESSDLQRLPNGDDRPVAMHLKLVEVR